MRHRPPDAATSQDADRVEAGRDEVVAQLGRLAEDRRQVRREALGPAEERADPNLLRTRNPLHGGREVWRHPVPVGRQLPKGERVGNTLHLPWRADRLKEAEHEAAALLPEVPVRAWIFEDRQGGVDPVNGLGDEVVVLGRLQRDADSGFLSQLACPHPSAVDHELRLDVAVLGPPPVTAPPARKNPVTGTRSMIRTPRIRAPLAILGRCGGWTTAIYLPDQGHQASVRANQS
jgi:hypothetical protein